MAFTPFVEVARTDGTSVTLAIPKIVMIEEAGSGLRVHLEGADAPVEVGGTREDLLDRIRGVERALEDELD
jgi:hypothetical protein